MTEPDVDEPRLTRRGVTRAVLDSLLDPHVACEPVLEHGRAVDFVAVGANEAACRYHGMTYDELLGRRLLDLLPAHEELDLLTRLVMVLDTGVPLAIDDVPLRPRTDAAAGWFDLRAARLGTGLCCSWREVSARHLHEQLLAGSERRYRLLAQNVSDTVMHSDEGRILWVSPALTSQLGWTPEQWVGHDFAEFVHPEELGRMASAREEVLRGEDLTVVRRGRVLAADGTYHWVETHAKRYVEDDGSGFGSVTSFRLVDAEVAAEHAVRESEARYRLLAENGSDVVIELDRDSRVRWVSPAVTEALGWEPEELVGSVVDALLHPDDRASAPRVPARGAEASGSTSTTVRFRGANGEHRWMSVRSRAVRDEDDTCTGAILGLRDVTAERSAQDELAFRAFHDPLTGLHNRAWVLDMLDADLRAAERREARLGVMFIDLDNFKVVNDSLGHLAGDTVLRAVAERIAAVLRPEDRIGRFGGDEFVVVVPDVWGVRELETIAERLSAAIAVELTVDGHRILPTASIGIAVSNAASTAESLLRDTDSALFRAKDAGRARWHFFDQEMHARAVVRLTIEDELRRALDENQFVVHYQPIVRLSDYAVVGHEALIRWNHPVRGLLYPGDFLSVAEDSGLIVPIGHQVLDQVCALLVAQPDLPGPISVNKSPLQIARPGWRTAFLAILGRRSVDPSRIAIEVTETAVLDLLGTAREDLLAVRDLGVGLHVDDFGTGYSSISLLRDLPVSGIKLDRSFTAGLGPGQSSSHVLAAGLAGLADGLHLMSIAEGVETPEQAGVLLAQGWSHGQGWLFGRPQPVPALSALVTQPVDDPTS